MNASVLQSAVATVPPGRWAIGVSGGADSVALLRLLHDRKDIALHVTHLDHETREGESAIDAQFVADLARQLCIPATIGRRSDVEKTMGKLLTNTSARFRAVRIEFFKQIIVANNLSGVILAHHADDQAETILQRLIRGASPSGLRGMSPRATINGVRILRPLLEIRSVQLREYLSAINQTWREDSSNRSTKYRRNQIRMILVDKPALHKSLIQLGQACRELRTWIGSATPVLAERFGIEELASLPLPIARRAAGRWLTARGSPLGKISSAICDQLIAMSCDLASSPRHNFPGGLLVRRRKGIIFLDRPVSS